MSELDRQAVERAAIEMAVLSSGRITGGWAPFLEPAERVLHASGLPAELQAAVERACAAEAAVTELARKLGAAEAAGWTGVVEEWRRRALTAEAVIEKARARKKGVLVQMLDDEIDALVSERDEAIEARGVWLETATAAKAERDRLASQLQEARGIVERLSGYVSDVAEHHAPVRATVERFLAETKP